MKNPAFAFFNRSRANRQSITNFLDEYFARLVLGFRSYVLGAVAQDIHADALHVLRVT